MSQIYLFCLVLGGGLAGLSVLGDALDFDAGDVDADVDAGLDADVDAGAELAEAAAAGDAAEAVEAVDAAGGSEGAAEADADAEKLFSIRGLVYALFGFGLAGTVLGWLGFGPAEPATLALAGAAGLGSGWVTTRLVGWLRRSESGEHPGESSFEGRAARVILPIDATSPGRVRVRRGSRTYDLRALPYGDRAGAEPAEWDEVVVVEMREGVAYVAPLEDGEDLRLTS